MAKEKDITEKQLEALNDVFADIINALIFNGRQVVKEDELEPAKRNRDSNIASLPTYPAITLVLHFGKKPWDGPTTLLFNLNFPQSTQTHHCCLQQGRLSGEHRSVWWFGIFGPEVKKSTRHISSYPPMAGYPCL